MMIKAGAWKRLRFSHKMNLLMSEQAKSRQKKAPTEYDVPWGKKEFKQNETIFSIPTEKRECNYGKGIIS